MEGRNFQIGEENYMTRNNYSVPGITQKRITQDEYRDELRKLMLEKQIRQTSGIDKSQEREILRLEEQAQLETLTRKEVESRSVKRSIAQDHFAVAQEKKNRQAFEKMQIIAEEQDRIKRDQYEFEYAKQAEAQARAEKLKANQNFIRQQAEFNRFVREKEKNDKIAVEKTSEDYINVMSSATRPPLDNRKLDAILKRHQGLDSLNDNSAALKQQIEKDKRDRANEEMRFELQRQNEIKLRERERQQQELWREKELAAQMKMQLDEMDELEKLKKQREQEALSRAYSHQIQEKMLSENRNVIIQRAEKPIESAIYQSYNGGQYESVGYEAQSRAVSQRSALSENSIASRGKARGQFSPLIKAGTSIFS